MLKSISLGISARGLICHVIWILAWIILFIIYNQAKIAVIDIRCRQNSEVFDYRFVCCVVLFHCDVIDMHFLHACWYWYAFFARRADMGNCDVTNITLCKFCIITTKYMINIYINCESWSTYKLIMEQSIFNFWHLRDG